MRTRLIQKVEATVYATIKEHKLFTRKDKILCAVSGGKDSTTILYILGKHYPNVEAITIDASIGNYSKQNLENIKACCKEQGIRLHTVSLRQEFGHSLCHIQALLKSRGVKLNSCAVCGVLKRYLLNRKARELKKDVLVTGHNLDDEAQSVLMNLLRGNPSLLAKLGPKTGVVAEKKFVKRVKPLYLVTEEETEQYSREMGFAVVYGRCPCALDAYRNKIRNLLADYELKHPGTKKRVVDYFLKMLKTLKSQYRDSEGFGYCKVCAEPSAKDVCKTCEILTTINRKS